MVITFPRRLRLTALLALVPLIAGTGEGHHLIRPARHAEPRDPRPDHARARRPLPDLPRRNRLGGAQALFPSAHHRVAGRPERPRRIEAVRDDFKGVRRDLRRRDPEVTPGGTGPKGARR
jgi:hypothetical protein